MNFEYDVIVVGSGPGGYVAAIRAAQLGHKTAVVEKDNLGGICLNWGCIPTKALLKSSEVYSILKKSDYYGISAKEITFDFDKVINRSRDVAKSLSDGIGFLLKKNNIDHISGYATILDENSLKLTDKSKDRILSFKNLIIATGARAKKLPNISFTSNIWSYREAMTPKELPKTLAVIGSGAIGIEFANFYNSLGVDVTVIELADKILPIEDNEISSYAKNELEKQGIKFQVSSYVESIE